jgi:hypothetical protein
VNQSLCHRFLTILAGLGAILSQPDVLPASSGGLVTLPPANVKSKSGLQVAVDSTWVDNFGYLPLAVTITSAKPSPSDQTITFRFKASTWQMGETPVMAVDQDIEMPEGSTSVSATVLVPKFQEWQNVWWDVLLDGSFEEELSMPWSGGGWFTPMVGFTGDTTPRILIVAEEGQQVTLSTRVIGSNLIQQQGVTGITVQQPGVPIVGSQASVTLGVDTLNFAAQRTVSKLPRQWLAYTSLDCVLLTPKQLEQLQDEQPEAWSAIVRWVRSGGNLWLHDVGKDWEGLPEASRRLSALLGADEESDKTGWYTPFSTGNVSVSSAFTHEASAQRDPGPLEGRGAFAWRIAGLGVVIISQKPFDQLGEEEWTWLSQQDGQQLGWTWRHGTNPTWPNADFANLLIPGVGLAPVTEFRILITLFVLVIGPVNYWVLKRSKRLHLLIITVPLAALVVTLALFAYAIVGDGLSTRMRVLSYTALDQRSREATSWARLSYYAGLAPSGGLEFPKETAIYPINYGWNDNSNFGDIQLLPRGMQWADRQYLTEGWLASRTPTQYLTVTSRPSDRKLDVVLDGSGVRVSNHLATPIDLLVLRDKDGRLFQADSIAAGASAPLSAVQKESDVAARLRRVFQENAPEFPEGFEARTGGVFGQQNRNAVSAYSYYYGGAGGLASTSRLEQRLASFTQPVDSQTGRSVNLQDGTFLAITREGVDLATGLEGAQEEASFHVVEGKW